MPREVSMIGICDFRKPGVRRVIHRSILVDQLYVWIWHNRWDRISKAHLRQYSVAQLAGMMNAIADGRGSTLMDRLLVQNGYNPRAQGLPPPKPRNEQQLSLGLHDRTRPEDSYVRPR